LNTIFKKNSIPILSAYICHKTAHFRRKLRDLMHGCATGLWVLRSTLLSAKIAGPEASLWVHTLQVPKVPPRGLHNW